MKRTNLITAIILSVIMAGCGGGSKRLTDDFIIVDVRKSYPPKELILQDFMDVEYIALNDTFVTMGLLQTVGKEIIVVRNLITDGDFFLFDRKNGDGIRKINRQGQGGEEYIVHMKILLDEENEELFILDNSLKKIFVYDLYGKYKRSLQYAAEIRIVNLLNYDNDHLIFYDSQFMFNEWFGTDYLPSYNIMSKHDGSIIRKIQFPFEKIISPMVSSTAPVPSASSWYPLVPYHGNWILTETSSDTIYQYYPHDDSIHPFIVRTPSIHSMDPEIFLYVSFLSDRYYFMETVKKEYDTATRTGYPGVDLVYDKQTNEIFQFTLYNDDYSVKTPVNMKIPSTPLSPLSPEIAFWHKLEAFELVEAYNKGILKGRLQEIAAELDEESNAVIMLVKHKK